VATFFFGQDWDDEKNEKIMFRISPASVHDRSGQASEIDTASSPGCHSMP
jgi:hypothetical protein